MEKLKLEQLGRISPSQIKETPKNKLVLILDSVRSLNNVGSVFRTSDSFLVEKIYLCGITGTPPHRDIQKTALGATETVSWEYFPEILTLLTKLKSEGYKLVALEQTNQSIFLHQFFPEENQSYAFILGNEVEGVSCEVLNHCELSLEIPQLGTKHSLNVSVATGILVWDFISKTKTLDSMKSREVV